MKPKLARGGRVGVVATGFAVEPERLERGVSVVRRMGYEVVLGRHVTSRDGYLAGDDASRAADLVSMFDDDTIDAIWFARGGYGTARLLDRLPWRRVRGKAKLLIGYSDLTALFAGCGRSTSLRCLHGPVVTDLGVARGFHRASLVDALAGRRVDTPLSRRHVVVGGHARGPLVGGNLCVLAHLAGTRFAPDTRGAVLVLEEVGEPLYRIDRALTQLDHSGMLRSLAGVVLGAFTVAPRSGFPPDRTLDAVVDERFSALGIPVVRVPRVGHVTGRRTLELGGTAVIDTRALRLRTGP